ncbi:hypothetical protein BDM02DRAFT_3088163 [Thelephora ganbajun]|uniref:Uncharacterized protein n=1 Tax=Thelephora ganbajun TaxID=370292 RepID=A0ACB6ZTY4_THEGA|nr:hypothetical protein BDM02DRAFT_3088163 [Thelephora ganbajun]
MGSHLEQDPFELSNLLPAGTIALELSGLDQNLSRAVFREVWPPFNQETALSLRPFCSPQDITVLESLSFLVEHDFIRATSNFLSHCNLLLFRVYLIPFDLPGVQGRLMNRQEQTLAYYKRSMKVILPRIISGDDHWRGAQVLPSSPDLFLPPSLDSRTMAEIYSELPSPELEELTDQARAILEGAPIFGLRSVLYPYQRTSVAAMLLKESPIQSIPDPAYTQVRGVGPNGGRFYFQPATLEVLGSCPRTSTVRGGILCEELGTGKTVMTLSLILSTVDQLPAPPETFEAVTPALTPIAFKLFPSEPYNEARKLATPSRRGAKDERLEVPSLLETMVHYVRINSESVGLQPAEEELRAARLWEPIMANTPFYLQRDPGAADHKRSLRARARSPPVITYLSPATLVLVPQNLLGQWENEINKHCTAQIPQRVLVIQKEVKIPPPKQLASDYIIVLMTQERFTNEFRRGGAERVTGTCKCPDFERIRITNCTCNFRTSNTPLTCVRWKRLVIDEGHVSSSVDSALSTFLNTLSVERRWIVTGTPTTNLLGLSFGQSCELDDDELGPLTDDSTSDTSDTEGTPGPEEEGKSRIWTNDDRRDLVKLSAIISHSLSFPKFKADFKAFKNLVAVPLLELTGPSPGAIQVFEQVMKVVMIRHRIEDVERDVVLPPLKQDIVWLDLDDFSRKSYNAMQAVIAINAIDTQRVDVDYFFHRRNKGPLLNTLLNMSQVLFWHTDNNLYSIVPNVQAGEEKFLREEKHRNISDVDRKLLHNSFVHMNLALEDSEWKAINQRVDTFYVVEDFPEAICHALMPLLKLGGNATNRSWGYARAEHLLELRDFVEKHPLSPIQRIVAWAGGILEKEARMMRLLEEKERKKRRRNKEKEGDSTEEPPVEPASVPETVVKTPDQEQEPFILVIPRRTVEGFSTDDLLRSSPVAQSKIIRSTSSKLNHIINEVLAHSRDEKFLIFSNSPLTLAMIADAFKLIHVNGLLCSSQIKPTERYQRIVTFETSDTYRVLLMELKHGARGLNIVTASRVIFCEPVWRADVESQAIKRVHRIGQTKPVTVKTLAIRSTMEEMMVSRRATLQSQAEKVSRNWAEESGMRQFIANPTFLEPGGSGEDQIRLEVPLIRIPPEETPVGVGQEVPLMNVNSGTVPVSVTVDLVDTTSADGRDVELLPPPQSVASPMSPADGPSELPRTKKRRVMFADE